MQNRMINKLILGTAQFGLDYGANNERGKVPRKKALLILEQALEYGIGFLETAPRYGNSEEIIGEFIKDNKVFFKIISKIPLCKPRDVSAFLKASLSKLNLNNLYGYLVHDFEYFSNDPKLLDELVKLKEQGKVEKIGFSLYYPKELQFLLNKRIKIDIVQIPFSIFDQRFLEYFPVLKDLNVEIHVRSLFLQGFVFKKTGEISDKMSALRPKLGVLHDFSRKLNVPIAAICLNFAVLNRYIDNVIFGVDSKDNLQENVEGLSYLQEIKSIYYELERLKEDDEDIVSTKAWSKSFFS